MNWKHVLIGLAVVGLLVGAYAAAERGRMLKNGRGGGGCPYAQEGGCDGNCSGLGQKAGLAKGFGAGVGGGRLIEYTGNESILGGCTCILIENESAQDGYTANCACRMKGNTSVSLIEGSTLTGNILNVSEGPAKPFKNFMAGKLLRNNKGG